MSVSEKTNNILSNIGAVLVAGVILIMFFLMFYQMNEEKKVQMYIGDVASDRTYCQGGFKWVMKGDWKDRQDPQLIGTNGGGVPCP